MLIDVLCHVAPWEDTTQELNEAVDTALKLSKKYQCDVVLRYNHNGNVLKTVSNY